MMCFLGRGGFNTILIIRFIVKVVANICFECMLGGYVCLDFIVIVVLLSVLNLMSIFYYFALCFSIMNGVCLSLSLGYFYLIFCSMFLMGLLMLCNT